MDGGFPTSLIHSVAVVLLVIDVVHAATLFSVEDFPEGQFVNGELRSAQKGQSKAYAALLTKPEAFAEQVLLGATKKRLLTSGALAYLLNPNLDKCQGKPDPPHSQEFVSAFSQGAGAAIELAQLAEQQPMRVPGTYGSLQVAAAPSPAGSGAPNLRVATLHIPASPSSPGEVADTILSGLYLALSSCAIPACNYKLRLVDVPKEEQRRQAFAQCGGVFCPFVDTLDADLQARNMSGAFVDAISLALSVPHGSYENQTFANLGALQDCLSPS